MIIVTGGAGFIGSALIWALNQRGISDIVVVDQLGTDEKWKNLRGLNFAEIIDYHDFLEMIVSGESPFEAEAVFHLGACSSTTETDADYLLKNNYEYSKQLASWAIDSDVRFIYASSAATYGDGSRGFTDSHDEIAGLMPLNMYGYSKQLFDLWAARTGILDQIAGLKYFNVFGPNEYHKGSMRSFVLKAFEQIEEAGTVKLFKSYLPQYPNGGQLRDFVYVKDAVEMTLFFLDHTYANGIYNVGTGQARTWNNLASAVFAAMGREVSIEYIDMPESIRNQYQYFTQADISKIRAAGYSRPITSIEEAVADYVQNYLVKSEYLGCLAQK
jgi:ADP-L-glycero-D-manno-heptose 6-epimerase